MTSSISAARSRQGEAGFTLLELLIAMTLLGLLMAVLFGGLRFGARAWERTQAHSAGTDDVRLVQALLRRELDQAYPSFVLADPTRSRIDFNGSAKQLDFLAPVPQTLGIAGRARITIATQVADGSEALVLRQRHELLSVDNADSKRFRDIALGTQIRRIRIFRQRWTRRLPDWHDRWLNQTRLPLLIRMRAEFLDGDVRSWPDLIVAPLITADVSCVYDVLAKYCRGR